MRWKTICLVMIATRCVATAAAAEDGCAYDAQTCLDYLVRERNVGWAGIEGEVTEVGYEITQLVADAPAARAGLRVGDVLTKLNGTSKGDANFEAVYRDAMQPGKTVTFTFLRGNDVRYARVELVPMPKDIFALMVGRHRLQHAETHRPGGGP